MTTRLVIRLLDADGQLLGWTEVEAKARGDGQLWSQGPVIIMPERAGFAQVLSIHWCDVNVETRVPCVAPVMPQVPLVVYDTSCPLVYVGPAAGGLPAVTVGSVTIGIPAGQLGARAGQMGG